MSVTHAKVSALPDGSDSSLVLPSDWNAAHTISLDDADIPATIARDSEVTSAIAALSATYQPLDSDLTAIAALSTTSYGRSLLALANNAALVAEVGATGGSLPGWYDVTDSTYGATGDGVTDDKAAIQLAIDAAGAAGGGIVYFPPGTYLLTALEVASEAHLQNDWSNVHFLGAPGATLKATDAYSMIYQGSHTKFVDQTVYAVTAAVARGAMSITTATAAHAGNFAAGDYIYIRTGQTVAGLTSQPDAEINQVVTATAGTGVITLAWPVSKAYAQEYYISGTTGFTSTNSTANAAIYGVSKITSLIVTNQSYRGLNFLHTGTGDTGYGMIGGQVLGCVVEDCSGTFKAGFQSIGAHRAYKVRNCRFHHPGAAGTYIYTLTTDSGCTDTLWDGNTITGAHTVSMHVHEGAARTRIVNNDIDCQDTVSDLSAIDIRSRAYDISVIGNTIQCATPSAITVDPDCTGGGIIANNQLLGTTGYGIFVAAQNWVVTGNRHPYGAVPYAVGKYGIDAEVRYLSCWVDSANLTVPLGILPSNSYVRWIGIQVTTAFTSSGTDTISIGFAADHTGFGAATDVSTTGFKTPTLGGYAGYTATGFYSPLTAYYVAGGTAPGAGKALVTVEYAFVAQWP